MRGIATCLASIVAGYTDPGEDQHQQLDNVRNRAQYLRQVALQLADDDAAVEHNDTATPAVDDRAARTEPV